MDLSLSRRVQRFPSYPVERKARLIFFLFPCYIPTKESSGVHFLDIGNATLGKDTLGVPEKSSVYIQGNPSVSFHSRPERTI
jgi:hypothetical protein